MSLYDPNFVSAQFAAVSAGYLRAPASELPLIKAALPRPATLREQAIYAAIEVGIKFPAEWDERRRRTA